MARKSVPFKVVPPPWTCKCTAYVLPFFYSASSGLPTDLAYAPLEAATSSFFSSQAEAGSYKGGLCLIQIIRYTETPVGPYDEMVLLPGEFGIPGQKGQNMRITSIYVSQKDTCYNGLFLYTVNNRGVHALIFQQAAKTGIYQSTLLDQLWAVLFHSHMV